MASCSTRIDIKADLGGQAGIVNADEKLLGLLPAIQFGSLRLKFSLSFSHEKSRFGKTTMTDSWQRIGNMLLWSLIGCALLFLHSLQ